VLRGFRLLDVASAAALTVLGIAEAVIGSTGAPEPWYVVATVPLVTVPVAARTRRPVAALLVLLAGLLAQALLGSDLGGGFTESVALVLVLYSAGARLHRKVALAALILAEVAVVLVITVGESPRAGNFVFGCTVVLVAWLAGRGVHLAEERSHLLSENRALQERSRIAGELHDVVSHNVTAMVIQAGARRREVVADGPEDLVLADIERRGRETLTELRRLLGLLRVEGADNAPLAPQPGLADLPHLVRASREAGLDVTFVTLGEPGRLGDGLELTIFRIVQEALTNAGKHAEDARVDVRLDCRSGRVGVEIVSRGGVRHHRVPGSGFGLRAMADRVHAYGGRLTAAPTDQGFRVHADIPLGRAE
jgi:signal transduction histidine kinase